MGVTSRRRGNAGTYGHKGLLLFTIINGGTRLYGLTDDFHPVYGDREIVLLKTRGPLLNNLVTALESWNQAPKFRLTPRLLAQLSSLHKPTASDGNYIITTVEQWRSIS